MNDHIEQLFQQAREQEPKLNDTEFFADFSRQRQQIQSPAKLGYEWILVLAAALATLAVFIFTPISFWLSALSYQTFSLDTMVLIGLSAFAVVISYFAFFDWEGI